MAEKLRSAWHWYSNNRYAYHAGLFISGMETCFFIAAGAVFLLLEAPVLLCLPLLGVFFSVLGVLSASANLDRIKRAQK